MQKLSFSKFITAFLCLLFLFPMTAEFSFGETAQKAKSDITYIQFEEEQVRFLADPMFKLRLGEAFDALLLKKKFPDLTIIDNADCEDNCSVVANGDDFILYVYGDKVIYRIESYFGSKDLLGMKIGDKFKDSLVHAGECESGYVYECNSSISQSMKYILDENELCRENRAANPSCNQIIGFVLHSQSEPTQKEQRSADSENKNPKEREYKFSDFPTLAYLERSSRISFPDFLGRDKEAYSYRTRIRVGLQAGPNFSGRYSVIEIGCGTSCLFAFVADAKTGEVFSFPYGGEEQLEMQLEYKIESRLLKVTWRQDENSCMQQYLEFNGREFLVLGGSIFPRVNYCN
jgi:hypothetical protein